MVWEELIPGDLQALYEIHDYKHAAAILATEFPTELHEICEALGAFRFTVEDITRPGGNESEIPKRFSRILVPKGWRERQLKARVMVDDLEVTHETHKVDYTKGRIALDVEWNSKDQTFDRDLFAFRAFFEYDKISVGVLVTRSNELDPLFSELGIMHKYGASTTQMGKLITRLQAGRNGGCPVLVFGITSKLLTGEGNE